MSIALGVLALLVALASVGYARRSVRQATRSADAAEASAVHARRSADAAEAAIHDQHVPRLKVWLDGLGPEADIPRAFYTVRNDGPQDLDAVTVYRPRPSGTVGYWVGPPGLATAGEQVSLGALALGGRRSSPSSTFTGQESYPSSPSRSSAGRTRNAGSCWRCCRRRPNRRRPGLGPGVPPGVIGWAWRAFPPGVGLTTDTHQGNAVAGTLRLSAVGCPFRLWTTSSGIAPRRGDADGG